MELTKKKALLLLSGGKDSHRAIQMLLDANYEVVGLCIDGIQGKEKIGALRAAEEFNIKLNVVHISFFDEETWNPVKLIVRDLAMGIVAIYHARKIKAQYLATGVKLNDINNPDLKWLKYFLRFGSAFLSLFGLQLIFPVWDEAQQGKLA